MNAPLAGKDGEAAFARLCEELRPDLYRFAFWLARDRAVAEDVVQEALLRAWASRGSLGEIGAAKPWLLTIVRREHARLYERKRHETVQVDLRSGEQLGEAYRKINPLCTVPALRTDDGLVLTDNAAITAWRTLGLSNGLFAQLKRMTNW